jgi:hypothetical protein
LQGQRAGLVALEAEGGIDFSILPAIVSSSGVTGNKPTISVEPCTPVASAVVFVMACTNPYQSPPIEVRMSTRVMFMCSRPDR